MKCNIMAPWYTIVRLTAFRGVFLPYLSRKLMSSKVSSLYPRLACNSQGTLTRIPFLRQILIPSGKRITYVIQMKCIHEGAGSESDSELEDAPEEILDLYNDPETFSYRQLLYPNSEHPLIKQLNDSTSVQDVFDFIREHKCDLGGQVVSQAVLVLWDLQKIFYKVKVMDYYQNSVVGSLLDPYDILNNYISEVSRHPDFEHLLQMVDEWNEDMSADAMTASLLYLNKMGVSQTHPVLQNLVARCESMLEDCGQRFPLTAMSRFAVAVHSRRGLWPVLISNKMLPCVLARIESCDNVEDFRLLTICLINICQLVTGSLLTIYKRKAEELADKGKITAHDARVISKAVRFLNYPHWSYYNGATIRKLLLIMKGNVSSVAPKDLISLHKIFQSQLEPADMAEEMHDAASQYLAQVEDERIASNPTVFQVTTDLLACMVSFSSPTQKLVLEKLAQHHVVGSSSSSLPTLFKILRHLKTSNVQLCDKFWSRTLRHMEEIPTEREDYKLFRVSHRYMHFNNNLGGTYRHYELEKQMIEWLWNEVKTGSAGVMPSKFARAAAFILAYGNIGQGKTAVAESTLTQMMHKLMDMAPQFSKLDCMYISRGLQIGAVLGYQKRAMTSQFLDVFRNIDTVMNNCTLEYLKDKEIALPDLNRMIKAYICRRGMHGTELFERLMQRYENFSGELCSRQLRDIANNLLSTNCLVPSILDQLVNYVLENGNHILGDTMVKLLYVCYSLGYMPTQAEKFFPVASSIISRDKERLQGLVLLNAAIALCFFHQLPEDLVHFIFTVSFLERLDEEVLNCYAKASYPTRIRHAMMQVNRAVCLDYPEADVPWFHEKYCEQITSLESPRQSSFRDDVYHSLVSVIGAENLVQTNKYSPYFYRIDFQVLLNKNEKPVTLRHQTDSNVTKLAVLLWDKTAYTNGVIQLCGEQQLKQRHLEMLGYRVIGINSSVWNSMYMAEQKTKTDYLKEQIWPSSTDSVLHHQKKS